MKNNISEFFKPIFQNGEEITPQKWINSFLLLVGIQFLWYIIEIFTSFDLSDNFEILFAFIVSLYIALLCYLIFRKQKWGWILLFAENLLTGLGSLIYLVILFSNGYIIEEEIGEYLWGLIISLLFISYLVKPDVYCYFKINSENKGQYIKRIFISVVTICTVGIVMVYLS